ncbi:MAG: diguanylate cyclase [Lachnospiraceae bacterium]|nr:diguanylate cyclase [Lachnospiraceae bacterium]
MDNQTKSVAVQWIGPSVLLIIALMVMVFNFSTKSRSKAHDTVTKNMTESAQTCLDNLTDELTLYKTVGEPIAALLEKKVKWDSANATEMLAIARKYSGTYEIYLCDASGIGINSEGEYVSIADKEYFEAVKEAAETTELFVSDDGIKGRNAIVVSIPVNHPDGIGRMLLFYPLNNFEAVVKKNDFVAWNIVSLIDADGTVLLASGTSNQWEQGDNIYEALKDANAEASKKMKSRIVNRTSGMSAVKMGDTENSLVYVPTGINEWTMVTGIPQTYIDRLVAQQWKDVKNMMYQLIAVIFVFICMVAIINIVSKIYNIKKQKQLEEKADTDLLTGLNNKLATERKIKEFIARNPNAQSMMFILDIDNFKKINDTMGHAFGDEVLRSLGQQISTIFRATDIVGRAGGDEFIVFLKNITQAGDVRKEAKKVEDFFKDFKAGEYTKYSATASIGVAIFPEEGSDFESIYKAADKALYRAKERGKNQLAFYKEKWMEESN